MELKNLLAFAGSRMDGVHLYGVDGMESSIMFDNANASYLYLPRIRTAEDISKAEELFADTRMIRYTDLNIDYESAFKLFRTSRDHTTHALNTLDAYFISVLAQLSKSS